MKTLIVSSTNFYSNYGGGQVYVKNIVNEMIRRKMDFIIANPTNRNNKISDYKGKKVYSFTHDMLVGDLQELKIFIKKINPDIVHAHGFKASFSLACKQLNIPCVVTAHHGGVLCSAGSLLNYKDQICGVKASQNNCLPCVLKSSKGGMFTLPVQKLLPIKFRITTGKLLKKNPFIHFITPIGTAALSVQNKIEDWKIIYNNASILIAPSKAIRDAMVLNGANSKNIKVVPHGIPLPKKPEFFKKQVEEKIENKPLKFFYLGRICHEKGVHVMLDAFSKINTSAELHIIGGAGTKKEEKYTLELKKKYKKIKNIIWHGKVLPEEVNEKVFDFDVMIHPTICMEVFGLNISEALSLGKPIIATRCGGAEMQITHNKNGLLVEPNNTDDLKGAIKKMIIDKQLVRKLKSNTPKGVISIMKHVNDLNIIYEALFNKTNINILKI